MKRKLPDQSDGDSGEVKINTAVQPQEFVYDIKARARKVTGTVSLTSNPREKIATLKGFLIKRGKSFYEHCDEINDELHEASFLFFEENGKLKKEFSDRNGISPGCNSREFLHIYSVEVEKPYRGRELSLKLCNEVFKYLRGRFSFVLMKPIQLNVEPDSSNEERDASRVSLARHFARLGFKQCSSNPASVEVSYWYIDATVRPEDAPILSKEIVQKLEVCLPVRAPSRSAATKGLIDLISERSCCTVFSVEHLYDASFRTRAQALIDSGADINASCALHFAVANKQNDLIEPLIALGANVNNSDYTGNTALHCAAEAVNPEAIQQLRLRGADKSICNMEGKSALASAKAAHKKLQALNKMMGLAPTLAQVAICNTDMQRCIAALQ